MRGKKPLSEKQVVALRKLVEGNELHELLLNLGVDLMLRASDLLNLKVSDVLNESGSVKKEVRVRMKKTKKTTLNLPLSKNSIAVIKKYLIERKREDFIFRSTHYHYTRKPLQSISIPESSKTGWEIWELKMFQNIPLIQSERPKVRSSMTERRMWMRWEGCLDSPRWLLLVRILGFLMRVH